MSFLALLPANYYFIVILDSSNATVYHSTDGKRAISGHGVWYSCSSRTILLYWQYNSQVTYNFWESCTFSTNFLHRLTLFLGLPLILIWTTAKKEVCNVVSLMTWPLTHSHSSGDISGRSFFTKLKTFGQPFWLVFFLFSIQYVGITRNFLSHTILSFHIGKPF